MSDRKQEQAAALEQASDHNGAFSPQIHVHSEYQWMDGFNANSH